MRIRGREIGFGVVGLVIGLVGGILLQTLGLFGSAVNQTIAPPAYYLLDMTTVRDWMAEAYPNTEDTTTAVEQVAGLPQTDNFRQAFVDSQAAVQTVLNRSFTALTGQVLDEAIAPTDVPNSLLTGTLNDGDAASCLGLSDDPYNVDGPAMFMYLQLPAAQADTLDLPETWQRLEEPLDNSLFWQLLGCAPARTSGAPLVNR